MTNDGMNCCEGFSSCFETVSIFFTCCCWNTGNNGKQDAELSGDDNQQITIAGEPLRDSNHMDKSTKVDPVNNYVTNSPQPKYESTIDKDYTMGVNQCDSASELYDVSFSSVNDMKDDAKENDEKYQKVGIKHSGLIDANPIAALDAEFEAKNQSGNIVVWGSGRISCVEIPRESQRLMGTLKNILSGDYSADEIICPSASEKTLRLLKKYTEYHLQREPAPAMTPITSTDLNKVLVDSWDVEFCENLDLEQTLELVTSAEYLDMDSLLDVLRVLVISKIGDCTREDILAMIESMQWPERKDPGSEESLDLGLEDNDDEKQIIFLKPSDYDKLDFSANDLTCFGVLHLIEILKEEDSDALMGTPAAFYESVAKCNAVPRDLVCSREDLRFCDLAAVLSDNDTVLPCKQVESHALKRVVAWLKHHRGVPPPAIAKPIRSAIMSKLTDDWQANFVNELTKKELFQLILAANYMGIKPLLTLTCTKTATMIKGKSPEQIKKILGEDE